MNWMWIQMMALGLVVHMVGGMAWADWRKEADERIEKHRKGDFSLRLTDGEGKALVETDVTLVQVRHHFRFGVSVTESQLVGQTPQSQAYRKFILDHFNTLVSDDGMKWYSIERTRGRRSFATGDRLVGFAREHGLAVRGHAYFWSKPKFVQRWVQELPDADLRKAIEEHIDAAGSYFKGKVIAWDLNNEMLDGSFFADRLGKEIRAEMFKRAAKADPDAPLFTNEYDILGNDEKLARYVKLIEGLRSAGAPVGGIGIQEHAAERIAPEREGVPDDLRDDVNVERKSHVKLIPHEMIARLDKLGELGLPIHITEISFKTKDDLRRAAAVEDFYRLMFSHPKVEAVLLWGFWGPLHWLGDEAALVDRDLKPLESARRLNKLLNETWKTRLDSKANDRGEITFRGFYGEYEVRTPKGEVLGKVRLTPAQREAVVKVAPAK